MPVPCPEIQPSCAQPLRLRQRSWLASWVELLRPGDWTKNLFVGIPLVFSGHLLQRPDQLHTLVAAAAFCLLSSGFYAINDAVDAESDKAHPLKRLRPIPSGRVSRRQAWCSGVLLVLVGCLLFAACNVATLLVGVSYMLLQFLYNAGLKRVTAVDVVVLSSGFVLRAVAGAMAISVPVSVWLLQCVFFLCLFLALSKRLADVVSAGRQNQSWVHPGGYCDPAELRWMLAIAATMTLMMYLAYTLSPHAVRVIGNRALGLSLLSPLLIIIVYRMYRQAAAGHTDRAWTAAMQDRWVCLGSLAYGLGTLLILYVDAVGRVVVRLFLQ